MFSLMEIVLEIKNGGSIFVVEKRTSQEGVRDVCPKATFPLFSFFLRHAFRLFPSKYKAVDIFFINLNMATHFNHKWNMTTIFWAYLECFIATILVLILLFHLIL